MSKELDTGKMEDKALFADDAAPTSPANAGADMSGKDLAKLSRKERRRIAARIECAKAQNMANAKPFKASSSIQPIRRGDKIECVCSVSGITAYLDIPALPIPENLNHRAAANIMEWKSPLASYQNCRGLAGAGVDYLMQLSTNVLAGILIVVADNYNLFRYSVSMSGVQKNAILRMAEKDCLVNAVGFIETWINTGNVDYLPGLSLALDSDVTNKEITIRLTEWLKLCHEALDDRSKGKEEEFEDEDDFYDTAPSKIQFASVTPEQKAAKAAAKAAKKEAFAEQNRIWKLQREHKAELVEGRKIIKQLAADKLINNAVKGVLISVFSDTTLQMMDCVTKMALIGKMEKLAQNAGRDRLIEIVKKDISPITVAEDDLWDEIGTTAKNKEKAEEEALFADSISVASAPTAAVADNAQPSADFLEYQAMMAEALASYTPAFVTVDSISQVTDSGEATDKPEVEIITVHPVSAPEPTTAPVQKETFAQKLLRIKAEREAREVAAKESK